MNFGDAIAALKAGKKVARSIWSDNAAKLTFGKENDLPLIYWSSDDHPAQVFHPSSPDMLADDWAEVA